MNLKALLLTIVILTVSLIGNLYAADRGINHDKSSKTITIADPNSKLSLIIDYSNGCKITQLDINGKNKLSSSGIYTGISTSDKTSYSCVSSNEVTVTENSRSITLSNISYGSDEIKVNEIWNFRLAGDKILWNISRDYSNSVGLDEMALPQWNFADISVWKGGIIDNGGMVWCKYLPGVNDTYGVHTGGVTFWEPNSGEALRISTKSNDGNHIATKFSHSNKNEFTYTHFVTNKELGQRHNLNRFTYGQSDIFAPFKVEKGNVTMDIELQYVDYLKEYSRGKLVGIDADMVRELLNTTGRYGVVDNTIIGANGWTSNWKCLHEPFFSQIGMAVNDKNYTANMSSTLDSERDFALLPNGRVLSRWHNDAGDAMPGTFIAENGYYEAQWGYTVDSQTGYIINTAEQFDICGDKEWLLSHKVSCEKALDWLINRDSNDNGIFEMMNDNVSDQTASDWLDIVWASFENAFVNAQMYESLNLWAECERILGDNQKSDYYSSIAKRLKDAFNQPIDKGGFWSPLKRQYIYWRDKDGSTHGDNLVTPVNFAAIAFGICDDEQRIAMILDQIEERNVAENLFHWPLCFDSYTREEVSEGNWPFPKYENGDIFPTWGYMGVRAYANYDKSIALKYINNLLAQYKKDGLSSQRYSRVTQTGLGNDILAGICTSVTALYRDIYGVRPKWNRMGLEPNMSESLNGTEFNYDLRDKRYKLQLSVDNYVMTTDDFSVKSKGSFGAHKDGGKLTYWHANKEDKTISIGAASSKPINLEINGWNSAELSWTMASSDKYEFTITGLTPNAKLLFAQGKTSQYLTANQEGVVSVKTKCNAPTTFSLKM